MDFFLKKESGKGTLTLESMQNSAEKTRSRLRLIAILEGISYLALLFVAMPMKYLYGNSILMRPVGMLHGWLFVLYVLLLLLGHWQLRWGWKTTIIGFVLSLLPFGTFYAERKYFRSTNGLSE